MYSIWKYMEMMYLVLHITGIYTVIHVNDVFGNLMMYQFGNIYKF